jgi:hypothetical protein
MPGSSRQVASARDILLALLRALPEDEAQAERLVAALPSTTETWQPLVEEATAHGVLGLIFPVLTHALMPPSIRADVERRIAVQATWQAHLRASLEDITGRLAAAQVRVCVLKGVALAERVYTYPEQRPSMDIDLLVAPEDIDRASAALKAAGREGDSDNAAAYLRVHGHHLHFTQQGQPDIELHFHAYAGFGVVLPASALLERAREQRVGAQSVLVPTVEDECLYLSAHAAGHSFIRLLWLYDLKLLTLRFSPDWSLVFGRAHTAGLGTAVSYAARLLREWLGVRITDSLGRDHMRTRLAHRLLAEVSRPSTPGPRDNLGGLLFTSMLCDRVGSSGWLLQHHLLRSTRRRLQRLAPGLLPERWAG